MIKLMTAIMSQVTIPPPRVFAKMIGTAMATSTADLVANHHLLVVILKLLVVKLKMLAEMTVLITARSITKQATTLAITTLEGDSNSDAKPQRKCHPLKSNKV